jgi:DNA integrity scanning protein DisA with diadenylate cyclase activity
MKIFADGVQIFRFLDGHWLITDAVEKFRLWKEGLSNSRLAEVLFITALNLAEDRHGGLLVVLDDPTTASRLISEPDLLASTPRQDHARVQGSKDQFHYLLRDKCVLNLPTTILETLARIDGAVVLDSESNLLAFGAILHYPDLADLHPENIEGGRSSAAIGASRFGKVLKISEDGLISFYQNGNHVWDM